MNYSLLCKKINFIKYFNYKVEIIKKKRENKRLNFVLINLFIYNEMN